ncbi:MAG: DUF3795 domain-containing protein [Nitrososphaeria archaeon]
MQSEDTSSLISFCGLCAQKNRIPKLVLELQKTIHEEGFDDFYQYTPETRDNFTPFWKFLQELTSFECRCRNGKGGPPDCKIRNCAKKRNIMVCPQCRDYPCKDVNRLAESYPMLLQDGKRIQKIGVKRWVEEQEERRKRGFSYADIRYKA